MLFGAIGCLGYASFFLSTSTPFVQRGYYELYLPNEEFSHKYNPEVNPREKEHQVYGSEYDEEEENAKEAADCPCEGQ